jgi:hypothetical protein
MANFSVPYEPQSTDHRDAEHLRHEIHARVRQRSIGIITRVWSILPDTATGDEVSVCHSSVESH